MGSIGKRRDRLPPPFARASGASSARFEPITAKGFSSLADWTLAGSISARLGGSEELTRALEENEWLWACANVKATAARSVELCLYASDDENEDDEIEDESDPILRLFRRPNSFQTFGEMIARHVFNRVEAGEDWWFLADAAGLPIKVDLEKRLIDVPTQIIQLRSAEVEIADCDKWGFPSAWKYSTADGTELPAFPTLAVLPFLDIDPYDRFRGLGASEVVARWLQAQFQSQRYIEGLTRNSGQPGGILKLPSGVSRDEIERQEAKHNDLVSDGSRRGQTMVLEGDVEFVPNQLAPKDMEFGTLLDWVRDAICAVTHVPPPMVGVYKDATYNNFSTAERIFWTAGVIPTLRSIEAVLNERFFPRLRDVRYQGYRAYFDIEDIEALREDNTAKVEACARVSVQMGAPYNEIAPLVGLDPVDSEWADVPPDLFGASTPDFPLETGDPGEGIDPALAPTANADGALAGNGVQQTLLNGAQMSTAVDVVAQVAAGTIPRDSGIQLLITLLALSPAQAEAVMGSAGTDTPTVANPITGDAPASPSPFVPASPDTTDPNADASKAIRTQRAHKGAPIQERGARVEYWEAIERRIGAPTEAALMKPALKFLRSYLDAQLARLRDFARNGKGLNTASGRAFAADLERIAAEPDFEARVTAAIHRSGDPAISPELARQSDVLLLNQQEWEAKMRAMFNAPIKLVMHMALADAAVEVNSISIGVGHPNVVAAMQRQLIELSHDVTGTLAERVRTRLVEGLAKATTPSDLQAAVKEVLPELEGSLKTAFANRDARAQVIARTESGKASNLARNEQFREDGITETQWLTEKDDSVRESHRAIDGEVVPLGTPFPNGLTYPQQEGAPASEVISCRCRVAPIFED